MRGCFSESKESERTDAVLPAYAGMFPTENAHNEVNRRSPRVCGDVSIAFFARDEPAEFSPRMRGCFYMNQKENAARSVLPAYAGMFLSIIISQRKKHGSPRVCGDVSEQFGAMLIKAVFSPRMRGCFHRYQ